MGAAHQFLGRLDRLVAEVDAAHGFQHRLHRVQVQLVLGVEVDLGVPVVERLQFGVGAAVGVSADRDARTEQLLRAGADVIVIDTAHAHSRGVLDAVRATKAQWPNAQLIAGNIATAEGCQALIDAGVDAVKV
ncbi:MAG TPA: IMP dehydrogenase, partial [Rubrivivax sp.]|nr:IMP dehydrogenase [Rubrivivax sp.]